MSNKIEAIYPLSPSQRGMLFESIAAGKPGLHIEQVVLHFNGAINLRLFEQAWDQVAQRHAVFRTGFVWKDRDQPLQFVLNKINLTFQQHDWQHLSGDEQSAQLSAHLESARMRGVDLAKPPLMHADLLKISASAYQFVWTLHHIMMDGWSWPIVIQEVLTFYAASATKQPVSLSPSRSYRDYITWLAKQDSAKAQAFWQNRLAGVNNVTALGTVSVSTPVSGDADNNFAEFTAALSAPTSKLLSTFAKQNRLTLNVVVQGAWSLLLSRYSGTEDVVFGSTVSARPVELDGFDTMVGLFINTLPIRVQVDHAQTLIEWLGENQLQQRQQQNMNYCSAGQVHQWSDVQNAMPLYESLLVLENYPEFAEASDSGLGGLTIDFGRSRSVGAQTRHPLTILIVPGKQLTLKFIYDTRRIPEQSIDMIAQHWLQCLTQFCEQGDGSVADALAVLPIGEVPTVYAVGVKDSAEFIPPSSETERTVAKVWIKLLQLDRVSSNDNFFELGGHSLLIPQLIIGLSKAFTLEIPLRHLIETTNLAALAERIEIMLWSPEKQGAADAEIADTEEREEFEL